MKYWITALVLALVLSVSIKSEAAIKRSATQKHHFMLKNPCPSTLAHGKYSCPGYVVDHIIPLACGGADTPDNMQWQTIEEGKAKDKWERKGCK
jgi:5-methylcytosine-specific restriction endonuclease McrA